MFGRPGLAQLMQAAERGDFDMLVSEAPDRISRDIADLATVHKTLNSEEWRSTALTAARLILFSLGCSASLGKCRERKARTRRTEGWLASFALAGMLAASHTVSSLYQGRKGSFGLSRRRPSSSAGSSTCTSTVSVRGKSSGIEYRSHPRAATQAVERLDDQRQRQARARHPPQSALCRKARLEPRSHGQGPDHRQARIADE